MMEGDTSVAPPDQWLVSRVCEEFSCLPSEAVRELDQDSGLLNDILVMRAFRDAHDVLQRATDSNQQVQMTPMMRRVMRLQFELMQKRAAP